MVQRWERCIGLRDPGLVQQDRMLCGLRELCVGVVVRDADQLRLEALAERPEIRQN